MKRTIVVAALAMACFAPPAEARTLTFTATADSRVERANPNKNFAEFNLKGSSGSSGCLAAYDYQGCIRSYLKFDVQLGANEQVGSATLKLTPALASAAGFTTHGAASNDWLEDGDDGDDGIFYGDGWNDAITWANRPAMSSTAGGTASPWSCTTTDCVSVNVTNLVSWNGNEATIILNTTNYFEALSKEDGATVAPKLVVETAPYSDTSPPTAPGAPNQGWWAQTSSDVIWEAATDNVRVATYRAYINGVLQGESEIYPWGRPAQVYGFTGLTCGTSYTATIRALDPSGNVSDPSPPTTIETNACGVHLNERFTGTNGFVWVHESDFWSNSDGQDGATKNPNWFAENGQVVIDNNTGHATPLAGQANFRIWTRKPGEFGTGQGTFGDVKVTHRLRINSYLAGAQSYHGVKLWLRRQLCTSVPHNCNRVDDHPSRAGYTAEYALKSDKVYIQKRANGTCTAGNDGDSEYDIIGSGANVNFEDAGWKDNVGGTIKTNPNGSVTIQVLINNQVAAEATDTGQWCGVDPYTDPGRVGLRSDNTDMNIDDLIVRDL
ncbi:MAG: hypothetical protein ACRDJY_04220 [Thermoleophilaceae bacterium]